jgi:hypothetical protein
MKPLSALVLTLSFATAVGIYLGAFRSGVELNTETTVAAIPPAPRAVLPPVETVVAPEVTLPPPIVPSLPKPAAAPVVVAAAPVVIPPTPLPAPLPVLPPPVVQPITAAVVQAPVPSPPVPVMEPKSNPADDEYNGYAALELAQNMEGMDRINMVREGISRLVNFNVDAAVQAANSLPNQHDHGVAVGSVVRLVADRNPRQAAEILFTQVPPATALGLMQYPRTAPLMQNLLAEQVKFDPAPALAWSSSFSAGSSASVSYSWSSSINDGSSRDAAMSMFARELASVDPGAALTWANSISDTSQRAAVTTAIEERTKR